MERLKAYLADSEITQAEFAERIGVSQPTISDWIKGQTRPTVDKLGKLSRVTGISLEDLISDLDASAA